MNQPRWYRSYTGHHIGWEIWSWKHFFLNISIGNFEFQINKYPQTKK